MEYPVRSAIPLDAGGLHRARSARSASTRYYLRRVPSFSLSVTLVVSTLRGGKRSNMPFFLIAGLSP